MQQVILLSEKKSSVPKKFHKHDNRFSETLVEYFLRRFTKKGDKVLDPFAGLGTTLVVAEQMARISFGVEYNKERFEYVKGKLAHPGNLIHGDALQLNKYKFPVCDFCMTSPPYMLREDKVNSLTDCTTVGNYSQYLKDMQSVFRNVSKIVKKNGIILVEVSNTFKKGKTTPLAWDIGKALMEVLHLETEIIIGAKTAKPLENDPPSYCLIYRNRKPF